MLEARDGPREGSWSSMATSSLMGVLDTGTSCAAGPAADAAASAVGVARGVNTSGAWAPATGGAASAGNGARPPCRRRFFKSACRCKQAAVCFLGRPTRRTAAVSSSHAWHPSVAVHSMSALVSFRSF